MAGDWTDIQDWLFGKAPEMKKLATGTKQQQQFGGKDLMSLLQQMMQPGGGYNQAQQYHQDILGNGPGGQGGAYQNFSDPYMQQFKQQIIPGIEERYAGMGALSSSGFGQALGGAASGLQSSLAQLFSQLQQQSAQQQYGQFNQMAQTGLNYQPFQYHETPGSQGALIPLATGAIKAGMGGM